MAEAKGPDRLQFVVEPPEEQQRIYQAARRGVGTLIPKGTELIGCEVDAYAVDVLAEMRPVAKEDGAAGLAFLVMPESVPDFTDPAFPERDWREARGSESRDEVWRSNTNLNAWAFGKDTTKPLNLYESARGKTLYVVGSGPSLAGNVGELARVRKGVVWATNASLKPIVAAGCTPDAFVCLDALSPEEWLDGVPESVTRTMDLITTPWVAPHVMNRAWRGRYLFRRKQRGPFEEWADAHAGLKECGYEKLPKIVQWLNVGFAALSASWMLAPKRVVLCGQDQCWTAGGIHVGEPLRVTPERVDRVQGIGIGVGMDVDDPEGWEVGRGPVVVTSTLLTMQRVGMLAAAKFLTRAGIQVINATEGGILYPTKTEPDLAGAVLNRRLRDVVGDHE